MQWKATADNVVFTKIEAGERKSEGGLVIPGNKGVVNVGIVLAAGPRASEVKPGDTIFYVGGQRSIDKSTASIISNDILAIHRNDQYGDQPESAVTT